MKISENLSDFYYLRVYKKIIYINNLINLLQFVTMTVALIRKMFRHPVLNYIKNELKVGAFIVFPLPLLNIIIEQ